MWARSAGKKIQAIYRGREPTYYFTDYEMSEFAAKYKDLSLEEKLKLGELACRALDPRVRNGKEEFYRAKARILSGSRLDRDLLKDAIKKTVKETVKEEFNVQYILIELKENREKPEKIVKRALANLVKNDLPEDKVIKSLKELEQALKRRAEMKILFEPSRKDNVVRVLKWFARAIAGELASKAVEGIVNGIIHLFE